MKFLMLMWSEHDASGGEAGDIAAWAEFDQAAREAGDRVDGAALDGEGSDGADDLEPMDEVPERVPAQRKVGA